MEWLICQLGNINMPRLVKCKQSDQYIIPLYTEKRMVRKTKSEREKLLYPGYIFVKDEDAFSKLKAEYIDVHLLRCKVYGKGGRRVIGHKNFTLEESDILHHVERSMKKIAELKEYSVQDKVKVLNGPFAGQITKVTWASENRVKLKLVLFNRVINVDFYKQDVELA